MRDIKQNVVLLFVYNKLHELKHDSNGGHMSDNIQRNFLEKLTSDPHR